MSLTVQTVEHERVVPTTQSRMTPAGQEQQANVTMRFADLRPRVTRQVDTVREEDVETTEGEGVDFLGELLELSGWTLVDDDETEPELP
jgi:hypothetical protein